MTAPGTWSVPSSVTKSFPASGPTERRGFGTTSYCNGYYFGFVMGDAVTSPARSAEVFMRYATDPTGTWTDITVPAAPATYTPNVSGAWSYQHTNRVYCDGTTYALLVQYRNTGTGAFKHRIWYATSPSGTWTSYEFDATNTYFAQSFGYSGGTWYMSGFTNASGAFIGTASSPSGTWTFSTASGTTSYSNANSFIQSVAYNGTHWVHAGNDGTTAKIKTAPAVTGPWTTRVSGNTGIYSVRAHPGGYCTVVAAANSGFNDDLVYYADDPTGTWSTLVTADHGMTFTSDIASSGNGWAVAGAASGAPAVSYLDGSSPAGTYTAGTFSPALGTADAGMMQTLAIGPGHWTMAGEVRVSGGTPIYNEIRYFTIPTVTTTTAYLRQRQSPVRAPSRVRGVDLRARQTPIIVK